MCCSGIAEISRAGEMRYGEGDDVEVKQRSCPSG